MLKWFYEIIYGAIADFFEMMGNMGADVFDLEWVKATVKLFTLFGWGLFVAGTVVAVYRYRLYSQNELSSEPKRFADALLGSVPITVIDYENLAERFEDEPKILSVMDFDLDDGTVSVTDADGSRAYSLQNVSAAAYQAHRSRQLTAEKKAEVFADYLDGKEIEQTSLVPEM